MELFPFNLQLELFHKRNTMGGIWRTEVKKSAAGAGSGVWRWWRGLPMAGDRRRLPSGWATTTKQEIDCESAKGVL